MNSKLLLPLVVAAFALVGCGTAADQYVNNFDRKLNTYQETGDADDFEDLIDHWKDDSVDVDYISLAEHMNIFSSAEEVKARYRDRMKRWSKLREEATLMLIDEQRWDSLSAIIQIRPLPSKAAAALTSAYTGDDTHLLQAIGSHYRAVGNLKASYLAYAKTERPELVLGLARHYGCGDLYHIWGELANYEAYVDGKPLPLSPQRMTNRELSKARAALRNGTIPMPDESCPLSIDSVDDSL